MPSRHDEFDDEAVQDILRLAIRKQGAADDVLRARLLSAADELGLSHDSVLAAEREYRVESAKTKELAAFQAHRRRAWLYHLYTYSIINVFLTLINLLSYKDDHEIWFMYPLLGWGIGLAIHLMTILTKPDPNSQEFKVWHREQQAIEAEFQETNLRA
jgi:hypothetical protein